MKIYAISTADIKEYPKHEKIWKTYVSCGKTCVDYPLVVDRAIN